MRFFKLSIILSAVLSIFTSAPFARGQVQGEPSYPYTHAYLVSINDSLQFPCGYAGTPTQQISTALAAIPTGGVVNALCYQSPFALSADIFSSVSKSVQIIMPPVAVTVNANATIPNNFQLCFPAGGSIAAGATYTLTNNASACGESAALPGTYTISGGLNPLPAASSYPGYLATVTDSTPILYAGQPCTHTATGAVNASAWSDGSTWYCTGAVGVPVFGEMTITSNTTATSLPTEGAFVQITAGWALGDDFANMTGGLTGTLTAANPLNTPVETLVSLSVEAGASANTYEIAVFKNGVEITEHLTRFHAPSTDEYSYTLSGIDYAKSGDVFDIRARCVTAASTSITVTRGNFSVFNMRQ